MLCLITYVLIEIETGSINSKTIIMCLIPHSKRTYQTFCDSFNGTSERGMQEWTYPSYSTKYVHEPGH